MFIQESGTPTQMYLRMQINIPVGEVSTMANSERFSNLVVPLVWSEIVSACPFIYFIILYCQLTLLYFIMTIDYAL